MITPGWSSFLPLGLLVVFGLVRWLAGVANHKAVGYLTVLIILLAVVTAVLVVRVPQRTTAGDRTLGGPVSRRPGTPRDVPREPGSAEPEQPAGGLP